MTVELVPVDDLVLERLVIVAVTDADADDVVPPIDGSHEWTEERLRWLRNYHLECRSGLDGAACQATYAVVNDGHVVGSVRLAKTVDPREVETGIWLAKSARAQGIGSRALAVVAELARPHADAVVAWTSADDAMSQRILLRAGATLHSADVDGIVRATIPLRERTDVA